MTKTKPLLRGHFHQAIFFVSLGACILLILKTHNKTELISTIIYSLGLLIMFGVSALYHRITWNLEKRAFMKKLDHSAIYIMIAGTFTPICLLALKKNSGQNLLLAIWIIATLGIIQSIFFVNIPKILSASLYLMAGYLIAPYTNDLIPSLGITNLVLLIAGGVVYSIGAICYALKRPVLWPLTFGYHEVFHILVIVGAAMHFVVIYGLI